MDRAPGNKMKDERAADLNTLGFEPGTQWSEVECSTARPSTLRYQPVMLQYILYGMSPVYVQKLMV